MIEYPYNQDDFFQLLVGGKGENTFAIWRLAVKRLLKLVTCNKPDMAVRLVNYTKLVFGEEEDVARDLGEL